MIANIIWQLLAVDLKSIFDEYMPWRSKENVDMAGLNSIIS